MNQIQVLLNFTGNAQSALNALRAIGSNLQALGSQLQGFNVNTQTSTRSMSSLTASARTLASVLRDTFVRAQQTSSGLSSSINVLGGGMVGLITRVGALTFGFRELGRIASAALSGLVGPNQQLENSIISYMTLLRQEGDTTAQMLARARSRLAELQAINVQTPFDLPALVEADRQLQVAGARTQEFLLNVANAAVVTRPAIRDLSSQLEQVTFAIARVGTGDFGDAFRRLRELAIATRSDLEMKGLKFDAQGTYLGTADQALTALNEILAEKFGGAAQLAARSMDGILSNISDRWFMLRSVFGAPIFDVIKEQLVGLENLLKDPALFAAAATLGQGIAAGMRLAISTVQAMATGFSQATAPALAFVDRVVGGYGQFAAQVLAALAPLRGALISLFSGDFGTAATQITNLLLGLSGLILRLIQNLSRELFLGGVNSIAAFADGMLAGASSYVEMAILAITSRIEAFLRGFSPPREGPLSTIDTWFSPVLRAYLEWDDSDFGALTTIAEEVQDRLTALVTAGKISAEEAIRISVGTNGDPGITQLVAQAIDSINQTGRISAESLMQIESRLGEQNRDIFLRIQERLNQAVLTQQIDEVQAKLRALDDPAARRRLQEATRSAERALRNARTFTQQRAARDQLAMLEAQEQAQDDQKTQLQQQLEILKQQQQVVADRLAGFAAADRLQERELRFMEQVLQIQRQINEDRKLGLLPGMTPGEREAVLEANRRAKAQRDYNFHIADTAGKLAILRGELANVEHGSEEYYKILAQIYDLEHRLADERESGTKKEEDRLKRLADAQWDYQYAIADDATRQQMLRDRIAAVGEESEEGYRLRTQLAQLQAAAEEKSRKEAEALAEAQRRNALETATAAEKTAILEQRLSELTPGTLEYLEAERELNQARREATEEQERQRKALLDYQLAIADTPGKIALLNEELERTTDPAERYRIMEQIANLQRQQAEDAARDAAKVGTAQEKYNLELEDTNGQIAILREKLAGLEPGSKEYFDTLRQIQVLEERRARLQEEATGKAAKAMDQQIAAQANLEKATGDYDGAIAKLRERQSHFAEGSKEWLNIEAQIERLQAQRDRSIASSGIKAENAYERQIKAQARLLTDQGRYNEALELLMGLRSRYAEGSQEYSEIEQMILNIQEKAQKAADQAARGQQSTFGDATQAITQLTDNITTGLAQGQQAWQSFSTTIDTAKERIDLARNAVVQFVTALFGMTAPDIPLPPMPAGGEARVDWESEFGGLGQLPDEFANLRATMQGVRAEIQPFFAFLQTNGGTILSVVAGIGTAFAVFRVGGAIHLGIQGVTTYLGPLAPALRGILNPFQLLIHPVNTVTGLFTALGTRFPVLAAVGSRLGPVFSAIWRALNPLTMLTNPVSNLLGLFRTGPAIFSALAVAINPVTLAIGAIALVIGLLTVAWLKNWGNIQGRVAEFVQYWNTTVTPTWSRFIAFLQPLFHDFQRAVGAVGLAFGRLWANLQTAFQVLSPLVTIFFNTLRSLMPILGGIAAVLVTVGTILGTTFLYVLGFIINLLSGVLPGVIVGLGGIIEVFLGVIQLIATVITGVVRIVAGIIYGFYTGDWQPLWQAVGDFVQGIIDSVVSIFTGAVTTVIGLAVGLWEGVKNAFYQLWVDLVGHSIIPDMVNGIVRWFQNLWDWGLAKIQGLADAMLQTIRWMVGTWTPGGGGLLGLLATLVDTALTNIERWIGAYQQGGMLGLIRTLADDYLAAIRWMVGTYASGQNGVLGWLYWLVNEGLDALIAWVGSDSAAGSMLGTIQRLANGFFRLIGELVGRYASGGGGVLGLFWGLINDTSRTVKQWIGLSDTSGDSLIGQVAQLVVNLPNLIRNNLVGTYTVGGPGVLGLFANLVEGGKTAMRDFVGTWDDRGNGVLNGGYRAWKGMSDRISEIKEAILAPFVGAANEIGTIMKKMANTAIGPADGSSGLNAAIKGFEFFVNKFRDAINWIAEKLGAAAPLPDTFNLPTIPQYARGTRRGYHPGGPAIVGEKGPEIVMLPRGSTVLPHQETARLRRRGLLPGNYPAYELGIGDAIGDVINWISQGAGWVLDRGLSAVGFESFDFAGDAFAGVGTAIFGKVKEWALALVEGLLRAFEDAQVGTDVYDAAEFMVGSREIVSWWGDARPDTTGRHEGIDILADEGTIIRALESGVVSYQGWNGFGGNYIQIRGQSGREHYYAHLVDPANFRAGQQIERGYDIGNVGHTPYRDGEMVDHLHYQISDKRGNWVDPKLELAAFLRELRGVTQDTPDPRGGEYWPGTPGPARSWISEALAGAAVTRDWLQGLSILGKYESGWNPRSINLWDSNFRAGYPSRGLAQTIPQTFNANKRASARAYTGDLGYANGRDLGNPGDIYDPIENLIAAINYIKRRYGHIRDLPGVQSVMRGGGWVGYATGGVIREPVTGIGAHTGTNYLLGEAGPEVVVPVDRLRERLARLRAAMEDQLVALTQELEHGLLDRSLGGGAATFDRFRAQTAAPALAAVATRLNLPPITYAPTYQIEGVNYTLDQIARMIDARQEEAWAGFLRDLRAAGYI